MQSKFLSQSKIISVAVPVKGVGWISVEGFVVSCVKSWFITCTGSISIGSSGSEQKIYLKQIEPWKQIALLRHVNEYIYWKQYWEVNDLDNIRLEEYDMQIYDRREKVFLKWRETTDGAGELEKQCQEDVKIEYCRVCKNLQYQVRLWTRQMEIKYFHKERQQWGRDKVTATSIKTLMAIVLVGIEMSHKISYIEEETSP